jgi:hypothetical protein
MTQNALDLMAEITPEDISRRLSEIDAERRALMTLLRSARSRRGVLPTAELPQASTEGTADE